MRASLEPIDELAGVLLLRCEDVRVYDQGSADAWARVREQALADHPRPVDLLFDLSGFTLEPNAISFWGRSEREFMVRYAETVVRFGRSPLPITTTLIEVAGNRYGFPANLADDRAAAIELLLALRRAAASIT